MIDDDDDDDDDDMVVIFLVYLTIIPQVHVGYEMVHVDSQRGV